MDYPGESNIITWVLKSRNFPAIVRGTRDCRREARRETMRLVGFEDGGRACKPRDAGGLQNLANDRIQTLLWSLQKGRQHVDTLILAR